MNIKNKNRSVRFFLPLLQINRNEWEKFEFNTYLQNDEDQFNNDPSLYVVFDVRENNKEQLDEFHEIYLTKNNYFEDYKEIDNCHIYKFNLIDFYDDYQKLYNSRYSTISRVAKTIILNFFDKHTYVIKIKNILNPNEDTFKWLADRIGVDILEIKALGETGSALEYDKETLIIKHNLEEHGG
jgi:hypothetical protein